MPDPLDVIAEIVDGHRLSRHANPSRAFCLDPGCDWAQLAYPPVEFQFGDVAHARHVAEVIRDALAPERIEWSLRQGGRISYGNEAQCRQTRAVGGGTVRRRTLRCWLEVGEWENVS